MSLRCLICGSSRLDPQAYKCDRCGGAIGLRSERCYISEASAKTLLEHADDLGRFGIKVERIETLEKSADRIIEITAIVLNVLHLTEALRPGTLCELVVYLRDALRLADTEVLRLRLDEPEQI